jgi:hypothetical protein
VLFGIFIVHIIHETMVAITDSLTSLKISAGVEELQSTCDHCLVRAVHAQGDAKFLTTPNDKVAFMICGGCKLCIIAAG